MTTRITYYENKDIAKKINQEVSKRAKKKGKFKGLRSEVIQELTARIK